MLNFDLAPFYRSTVGFDRLIQMLDKAVGAEQNAPTYPPYNIERTDENAYRISLAVAGFGEKELSVETRENTLTVRGAKEVERQGRQARPSLSGHRRSRVRAPLPACRPCRRDGRKLARTGCSTSIWSAKSPRRRSPGRSRSVLARRWRLRPRSRPLRPAAAAIPKGLPRGRPFWSQSSGLTGTSFTFFSPGFSADAGGGLGGAGLEGGAAAFLARLCAAAAASGFGSAAFGLAAAAGGEAAVAGPAAPAGAVAAGPAPGLALPAFRGSTGCAAGMVGLGSELLRAAVAGLDRTFALGGASKPPGGTSCPAPKFPSRKSRAGGGPSGGGS